MIESEKTIVICGSSTEATYEGVKKFCEDIVGYDGKVAEQNKKMEVGASFTYRAEYPYTSASLNGIALEEYVIAVVLICGEKDTIVPYLENGAVLAQKYRSSGLPFLEILKPDCDHHPHGLKSLDQLVSFVSRYV